MTFLLWPLFIVAVLALAVAAAVIFLPPGMAALIALIAGVAVAIIINVGANRPFH